MTLVLLEETKNNKCEIFATKTELNIHKITISLKRLFVSVLLILLTTQMLTDKNGRQTLF